MQTTNKKQFSKETLTALKILIVMAAVIPGNSKAVSTSTTVPANASTMDAQNSAHKSQITFETGIEYSQRIAEDEQAKREEAMDITLAPGYRINELYSVGVKTILTKENTGTEETKASDTLLTLSIKGITLSPELSTVHSVFGVIPTSEKSRDRDRLQGAAGLSNGIHYANPLWDIVYRLGYSQNFHEFNLNADGSANVQQSLSHSLGVKLNVTEKFYLSSVGIYRWGKTYGNKERSSFELHGDLNYDVTGKMTLNLGTSNAGSALKANGVSSNITAFNPDRGVIRAGISISL